MKTRCASALLALAWGLLAAGHATAQAVRVVPVLPVAPANQAMPPAPPPALWTVAQLQEAFTLADTNGDRQLTRAEAQQLAVLPRSFEEIDANKDGVLTRVEYESIAAQ